MSTKMKFELLPNEIFIECFQYLNAPDIFHSFDRLNYRFHTLIRNISLHLNFYQFKKSLFNDFCQTITLNPELKRNIIYLKLSNEGTCGQIQSFLSLFSLNEFIHLRSLSLIEINEENRVQLLPTLSSLSNLYCCSCIISPLEYRALEIIFALARSKIRILTVSYFDFYFEDICETISVTSLIISCCDIFVLCDLFKYTPMLKYLKIGRFYDTLITDEELDFTNINAIHLKQLTMNYSTANFQILEILLKCTPNLKIFSIFAQHEMEMIDANRWQHLIESSLPHLNIFKFNFACISPDFYNEKLIMLQQFQTDFWHKQHHWCTTYEIDQYSALVYTIPYIRSEYTLICTRYRYSNSFINYSNEFNNVKKLSIWIGAIKDDSSYYFQNVQSLRLTNGCELDEYKLKIKFLDRIMNLSTIKHLIIADECQIRSLSLLKILKKVPNVSSLTIDKKTLIRILKNDRLCKYLNKMIIKLVISSDLKAEYIPSNKIDLFCKTFSNIEQLECYIKNLDDLLLILEKCPKLAMLKLTPRSEQIYSWVQINKSLLDVYIDCSGIYCENHDDM